MSDHHYHLSAKKLCRAAAQCCTPYIVDQKYADLPELCEVKGVFLAQIRGLFVSGGEAQDIVVRRSNRRRADTIRRTTEHQIRRGRFFFAAPLQSRHHPRYHRNITSISHLQERL